MEKMQIYDDYVGRNSPQINTTTPAARKMYMNLVFDLLTKWDDPLSFRPAQYNHIYNGQETKDSAHDGETFNMCMRTYAKRYTQGERESAYMRILYIHVAHHDMRVFTQCIQ